MRLISNEELGAISGGVIPVAAISQALTKVVDQAVDWVQSIAFSSPTTSSSDPGGGGGGPQVIEISGTKMTNIEKNAFDGIALCDAAKAMGITNPQVTINAQGIAVTAGTSTTGKLPIVEASVNTSGTLTTPGASVTGGCPIK